MSPAHERRVLAALLFGNFVIGTGVLLPAGMLTELSGSFGVSIPFAGSLMLVSGVVVAVGAPLAAAFASAIDRRLLLIISMALYALCHALSAAAPSFVALLVIRFALAIPAAIFTPQAAATVSALLPPERRSGAITMIFIGWSLATVGGMPLGGYVAHVFGWRVAFTIVAALSVLAWIGVAMTIPKGVRIQPLNLASWGEVLKSEALMTVLLVTVLNGTGQFTFFTYLAPALRASLTADVTLITLVLAWYGTVATFGNVLVTRFVGFYGAPRTAFWTLLSMTAGMALWGLVAGSAIGVFAAATLWGLGTFATNSVQQARLAGIAPHLTSASIALNTSAIYFGQAAGSAIGGGLIKTGFMPELPWAGAAILILAIVVSIVAQRWEGAKPAQSPTARGLSASE
jgi:predicted MFS family arabinose efflux permease